MTIQAPPVGARVRHTTRYPDSTIITIEGRVVELPEVEFSDPYICIGDEARVGFLIDRKGYTVHLEVLDVPPAEPPNGTVYVNGTIVWTRDDEPELDAVGRWWGTHRDEYERWAHVAPIVTGSSWRRYIPAPDADASELPLNIPTKYGHTKLHVETTADGYLAVMVTGGTARALINPAGARELAAAAWAWAAREVWPAMSPEDLQRALSRAVRDPGAVIGRRLDQSFAAAPPTPGGPIAVRKCRHCGEMIWLVVGPELRQEWQHTTTGEIHQPEPAEPVEPPFVACKAPDPNNPGMYCRRPIAHPDGSHPDGGCDYVPAGALPPNTDDEGDATDEPPFAEVLQRDLAHERMGLSEDWLEAAILAHLRRRGR